jgi:uncharacterized Zn finger protein/superfamily II DNA or RNA helicase
VSLLKFGQTWWGKAWLKALTQIDHGNHLPRGRACARSGAVEQLRITGNHIDAMVKGSQRFPYKVNIRFPAFTEQEKQILTRTITEQTLMLTRLLNRELPPELESLVRSHGIQLFAESWDDLSMSCSCPDSAMPCKHLAAVIYMLANEIDKNPFLTFQLHDYDIRSIENRRLPAGAARLKILPFTELTVQDPVEPMHQKPADSDYSTLPELTTWIMALLKSRPLFFDKDFKTILKTVYKTLAVQSRKPLFHPSARTLSPLPVSRMTIRLSSSGLFQQAVLTGETPAEINDFSKILSIFENLEPRIRNGLYPVMAGFDELLIFTRHCLEKGAFIPQLILTGKDKYRIRWIPALMNETVRQLVYSLADRLTFPIVEIQAAVPRYQAPFEQTITLFSLIIDEFLIESNLYEDLKWRYASSRFSHKILELFFDQADVIFGEFHEREIPQTIQQWFSKITITHRDHVPLIRIIPENDQFIIDLHVEMRKTGKTVPLQALLEDSDQQETRFEVLRDLSILVEYFPQLETTIQSHGRIRPVFHAHDFKSVLLETLPVIRMLGIRVLMPKSLMMLIRPRMSLEIRSQRVRSTLTLEKTLAFDWKVALGDQLMDPEEFRKAVKDQSGLVKLRDQYVLIDQKEIDRILRQLNQPPVLDQHDLLKSALTETYEEAHVGLTREVYTWIRSLSACEPVESPGQLKATLRPYQETGFQWLVKNGRLGFGSLLADDMGLGKTVQVLTALLTFKIEGLLTADKALIVVPTTLITNWVKEIEMFTPDLIPFIYHGQNRRFDPYDHDLVITSYGIVRSELKTFLKRSWYALVLDEAQNIKNPGTAQTRAVKKIRASVRIAMSGTPVENRLSEYWSIMDFVNRGYLGSLQKFNESYAKPIQLDHNHEKIEHFRKLTAPFILRREKTDKTILRELPEKIENNLYCHLTAKQTAVYQNAVNHMLDEIGSVTGIARRGLIFKLMTALKQICDHPVLYLKSGSSDPDLSSKTCLLWNILDTIHENNEKVLIFTQYREMGHLLTRYIQSKYEAPVLFLHGGTPRIQRDSMVNAFQTQRHVHTFLLSLKAGGTGLNLTAAQNVIHFDLWWNPAVEDQATDRAYRIGQTRNVMVYRLLNRGTFEEHIDEMLQDKKWLARMTIASGEKWIGVLSDRELRDLVRLG